MHVEGYPHLGQQDEAGKRIGQYGSNHDRAKVVEIGEEGCYRDVNPFVLLYYRCR